MSNEKYMDRFERNWMHPDSTLRAAGYNGLLVGFATTWALGFHRLTAFEMALEQSPCRVGVSRVGGQRVKEGGATLLRCNGKLILLSLGAVCSDQAILQVDVASTKVTADTSHIQTPSLLQAIVSNAGYFRLTITFSG